MSIESNTDTPKASWRRDDLLIAALSISIAVNALTAGSWFIKSFRDDIGIERDNIFHLLATYSTNNKEWIVFVLLLITIVFFTSSKLFEFYERKIDRDNLLLKSDLKELQRMRQDRNVASKENG